MQEEGIVKGQFPLNSVFYHFPKMGGTQLYTAASPNVIVFSGCLPLN